MKNLRIGPVGEIIVASIAVVGVVSLFALFPGMTNIVAPFIKKKKYPSKQVIKKSVESLVRSGILQKIIDKKGNVQLCLTQKGKWEAFLRHNSHDSMKEAWDGEWRVVVFDIPQTKTKIRTELRRAVSMYGFKILQQSVWVYPYACDDFIALLKTHLGVSKDVLYMKVKYIENDRLLKKEFSL